MNSTKKTLTTLSAAVALALGGIAVAQTTGSDTNASNNAQGADTTLQSSDSAAPSTSGSSDTSSSTLSNSGSTSELGAGPAPAPAQVDRN